MKYFKFVVILHLVANEVTGLPSLGTPTGDTSGIFLEYDVKSTKDGLPHTSLIQHLTQPNILESYLVQKLGTQEEVGGESKVLKAKHLPEGNIWAELGDDNVYHCNCSGGPSEEHLKEEVKKNIAKYEEEMCILFWETLVTAGVLATLFVMVKMVQQMFFKEKLEAVAKAKKFVFVLEKPGA